MNKTRATKIGPCIKKPPHAVAGVHDHKTGEKRIGSSQSFSHNGPHVGTEIGIEAGISHFCWWMRKESEGNEAGALQYFDRKIAAAPADDRSLLKGEAMKVLFNCLIELGYDFSIL